MPLSRLRFVLAIACTALTPALIYFYAQFFVSGATFYEGRRDWGHVYKYVGTVALLGAMSVPVTLALGFGVIALVKRTGPFTAARLFMWAVSICTLLGLATLIMSPATPFLATLVFCSGLFLISEFVVLSRIPWRGRDATATEGPRRKRLDLFFIVLSALGTLAGVAVLVGAAIVSHIHPSDGG